MQQMEVWRYIGHGNPNNCIKKKLEHTNVTQFFTQTSIFQSDWVGIGIECKFLKLRLEKSAVEQQMSKIDFETCYPM